MSNTTLLLIAIALMMLVSIPVVLMMKELLPGFIERTSGLEGMENRIYVLHAEVHDRQDRVNALLQRRNQQSSEKHRIESDIRKAEKAIAETIGQPPLFVHEVGDPQAGMSKFVVTLTQEKASAVARAAGDRAAVNPIWRHANVAEVWASSVEEAKQLVEVSFPFKMGFQKSFQKSPATGKAGAPPGGRRQDAGVAAS